MIQILLTWNQKLHIIEAFNGSYFFGLPGTTQTLGAVSGLRINNQAITATNVSASINLSSQQFELLQKSYDAIKGSVYGLKVDEAVILGKEKANSNNLTKEVFKH